MEISYCKLIKTLYTVCIFCCSELFNAPTDAFSSNESWLNGKNASNQFKNSNTTPSSPPLLSSKNDSGESPTDSNVTLFSAGSFMNREPDTKDFNFNHRTSKDIPRFNSTESLFTSNDFIPLIKNNSTLQVGLIGNLYNFNENSLRSSVNPNDLELRVDFAKNPSDMFLGESLIKDTLVTDYFKKVSSQDQTLNGEFAGEMTPEQKRLEEGLHPAVFPRVLSAQQTVVKRSSKNARLRRQVSSSSNGGGRAPFPCCNYAFGKSNFLTPETQNTKQPDCGALRAFTDKEPKESRAQHTPCGHRPAPLIVGGKDARPGAWTWMAGLYTQDPFELRLVCGSTIINTYYVVTAGHCVMQKNRTYLVLVGSIRLNQGESHPIDNIISHPDYKEGTAYNDIAVLRVKKPFQFGPKVQPICLPTAPTLTREKLEGRAVTVTGWGYKSIPGERASTLQELQLQVVGTPSCREAYKNVRSAVLYCGLSNHFLCAGVSTGVKDKDACIVDSGGPLMLHEKGVWHLIGIVSFGAGCGKSKRPGGYTLVTNHLDWLQKVATVL